MEINYASSNPRPFYKNDPHMYVDNSDITKDIIDNSFKDKKILTLGGTGDFFIDSTLYGVKNVTLFDINRYQYYLIALKMLAVQKLSYEEYKDFFLDVDSKNYLNPDIIKELLIGMDGYASTAFWKKYVELKSREKYSSMNLFSSQENNNSRYIQSTDDYQQAQEGLANIEKATFLHSDIRKLVLNDTFDRIYLGNSPALISNVDFRFSVENLKKLLSEDGEILYYIRNPYIPSISNLSGTNKVVASDKQQKKSSSKGKLNILNSLDFDVTPHKIDGKNDIWIKAKKRH